MRDGIRCLSVVFAGLLLLSLFSCGGGGETSGTPGTEGEWNPVFSVIGGYYCDSSADSFVLNSDVDSFFDTSHDCNPDTPAIELEVFTTHHVRVEMFNADLPGRPGSAKQVTFTSIDVEYRRPTGYPPAPVLQSRKIFQTISLPPKTEAETRDPANATVFYIDLASIATKDEYQEQIELGEVIPPDIPTQYEAVYTLHGASIYDDDLVTTFVVPFQIGNFDYCKCLQ